MSVLISVPIGMAISQYSNLNHACDKDVCIGHNITENIMHLGEFGQLEGGGCHNEYQFRVRVRVKRE